MRGPIVTGVKEGVAPTVTGSNTKLQGLKVLVIDDSKTIRRTAETLLAKEGCEVFPGNCQIWGATRPPQPEMRIPPETFNSLRTKN